MSCPGQTGVCGDERADCLASVCDKYVDAVYRCCYCHWYTNWKKKLGVNTHKHTRGRRRHVHIVDSFGYTHHNESYGYTHRDGAYGYTHHNWVGISSWNRNTVICGLVQFYRLANRVADSRVVLAFSSSARLRGRSMRAYVEESRGQVEKTQTCAWPTAWARLELRKTQTIELSIGLPPQLTRHWFMVICTITGKKKEIKCAYIWELEHQQKTRTRFAERRRGWNKMTRKNSRLYQAEW